MSVYLPNLNVSRSLQMKGERDSLPLGRGQVRSRTETLENSADLIGKDWLISLLL
jgi:hypothetical protein